MSFARHHPRFGSVVLTAFALIAVVLAAVGIYGLLAFVVGASRREIAIRMALGSASVGVIGLVVRKGMSLAIAGIALGTLLSVPATRAMTALLFGVSAGDPLTTVASVSVLLAVSLLACWFPASCEPGRSAGRVEVRLRLPVA